MGNESEIHYLYLDDQTRRVSRARFTTSSAGPVDADKPVALDETGKIHPSMLAGDNAAVSATAHEGITAGDFVTFVDHGGSLGVVKASAGVVKRPADGFAVTSAAAGELVEVALKGVNQLVTGFTPGVQLYLSTTPGMVTTVVTRGVYHLSQPLGAAAGSNGMVFVRGAPVIMVV